MCSALCEWLFFAQRPVFATPPPHPMHHYRWIGWSIISITIFPCKLEKIIKIRVFSFVEMLRIDSVNLWGFELAAMVSWCRVTYYIGELYPVIRRGSNSCADQRALWKQTSFSYSPLLRSSKTRILLYCDMILYDCRKAQLDARRQSKRYFQWSYFKPNIKR